MSRTIYFLGSRSVSYKENINLCIFFLTISGYEVADFRRTHSLLRTAGTASRVGPPGGRFTGIVPRIEASSYGV